MALAECFAARSFFAALFNFFFDGAAAQKIADEDADKEDDRDIKDMGGGHFWFNAPIRGFHRQSVPLKQLRR